MNTRGSRLREERARLGLNQDDLAAAGGVKRRAQINYEQDERSPDAEYLAGVAAVGGVEGTHPMRTPEPSRTAERRSM